MKRAAICFFAFVFFVAAALAQVPNVGGGGVPNSSGGGGAPNVSNATGILPVANGGVPQGAWTAGAPSPTCGTATFTATSRSQQIAPKSTLVQYDVLVTAIGTCTSLTTTLTLALPNTAQSTASAATYDFIGAANVLCWIAAGGTTMNCRTASATGAPALVTNSHFDLSAVYENQ